jgi:hypothetical protein
VCARLRPAPKHHPPARVGAREVAGRERRQGRRAQRRHPGAVDDRDGHQGLGREQHIDPVDERQAPRRIAPAERHELDADPAGGVRGHEPQLAAGDLRVRPARAHE